MRISINKAYRANLPSYVTEILSKIFHHLQNSKYDCIGLERNPPLIGSCQGWKVINRFH